MAIAGASVAYSHNYDFELDGIYYRIIGSDQVSVVSKYAYTHGVSLPTESYTGDMVIPASVEIGGYDFKVVSIGDLAFSHCQVRSVTIQSGVSEIGIRAFFESEIEEIDCGDVKKIGVRAFYNCKKLQNVKWSDCLESIGDCAFHNTGLKCVVIPPNLKSLGKWSFYGCENLSELIFEDNGVFNIDSDASAYDEYMTNEERSELSEYYKSRIPTIGNKPRHGGLLYLGRNLSTASRIMFEESMSTERDDFLKTVILGKDLRTVPFRTFTNDLAIEVIYCLGEKAPEFGGEPKNGWEKSDSVEYFTHQVLANTILSVPVGCREEYASHAVWGRFANIVEDYPMPECGSAKLEKEENKENPTRIYAKGRNVIVENNNNGLIMVYAPDGRIVYQGKTDCIEMPAAGIYIVRTGNHATKVLVK